MVTAAALLAGGSASAVTPSVTCDHLISGDSGAVVAGKGLTCVLNARVHGGISATKGARVVVQNTEVDGSINAQTPNGFLVCGTRAQSITVTSSTAGVLIGNEDACDPNVVHGNITVVKTKGDVGIVGNTVGGSIVTHGTQGAEIISGNHL